MTATSVARLSEQRMEAQRLAEQAQGESSEAKRLRLEAVHSYSVWATEREHFWGEIYDLQEELSQRDSLAATLELQAAERDAQHAAHLRSEMGEVVAQVKTLEEEKKRDAEDRAEARAEAEKDLSSSEHEPPRNFGALVLDRLQAALSNTRADRLAEHGRV